MKRYWTPCSRPSWNFNLTIPKKNVAFQAKASSTQPAEPWQAISSVCVDVYIKFCMHRNVCVNVCMCMLCVYLCIYVSMYLCNVM